MKKIFLGFIAIMMSAIVLAAPRTAEQAATIAAEFTNAQPQLSRMHKAPRKANNMRLVHTATKPNSTEAAYYVFNQEDNAGSVIISADDRTLDVLGYTDNGQFDPENVNPNLKFWLNRYAEEIANVNDDNAYPVTAIRKATQATVIEPLLGNITWYQEAPYSDLLPMDKYDNTRCLTGCVATAASQIMRKWKHPVKGVGEKTYTWKNPNKSSQSYTFNIKYGSTTYDWDNMLPAYEGKSYNETQANAVATLMMHAGVACNMSYGGDKAGGSGAWTDDMGYGLVTYFDYSLTKFISMYSQSKYKSAKGTAIADIPTEFGVSRDKFVEYFNADLEAGRPIIMGGEDSDGGHEFVCDGRDASGKFHINWGWEGDGNGHFALSSLKPTGTSYNFSSNLDAIIGLEPALFTVYFEAGKFGTCATEKLSQSSKGASITLPAVTANTGYTFLGWATSATATTADAGQAGDSYTPTSSQTLHALYSHPGYVSLTYSLHGVTKTAGPNDEILVNDGFTAKFTANEGYGKLCADSCEVTVTINGGKRTDCYAFNDGVLTITLTKEQLTGAVVITVTGVKRAGSAFELVTKMSDLAIGDELIIVSTKQKVAATNISSSIMGTAAVIIENNKIELSEESEVMVFKLGGSEDAWTLTNPSSQKLGATDIKKLAWNSGTTVWNISFSDGDATIQNDNSSYGRILYNVSSPRFTTYSSATSTTMLLPQIYARKAGASPTPTEVAVTSVSLNQTEAKITVGTTLTLTVTVLPNNATNKNVSWSSSDNNVATVANGVVTAYKVGTATITVTTKDGNKTATCAVTVVSEDTPLPTDPIKVTTAEAKAAALELAVGEESTPIYAVTGYITYVYTPSGATQSFWMDDEVDGDEIFQGYYATIPDEISQFTEGLHVCLTGKLFHYYDSKKKVHKPEIVNGTVEILKDPTAIDQTNQKLDTNSQKLIQNGQFVIIIDGRKYNALGQSIE